jgi:hypothetical protein
MWLGFRQDLSKTWNANVLVCNPTHDKQAWELIVFLFVTNAIHMLVFVIILK